MKRTLATVTLLGIAAICTVVGFRAYSVRAPARKMLPTDRLAPEMVQCWSRQGGLFVAVQEWLSRHPAGSVEQALTEIEKDPNERLVSFGCPIAHERYGLDPDRDTWKDAHGAIVIVCACPHKEIDGLWFAVTANDGERRVTEADLPPWARRH